MPEVTRPARQGNRRLGARLGARCLAALLCANTAGCGGVLQLDFVQDMWTQKAYREATQLTEQGRYAQAAEILWNTAQDLPPPHREKMQVESARALLDGQYLLHARQSLALIDESALDAPGLLDKRVLEAVFYREAEQPARILELLPDAIVTRGAAPVRAAALELLAAALFDRGRYFDSVTARLRRRELLDADAARENTMALWKALTAADPADMAARLATLNDDGGGDLRLRAWLELAALATPREIDRTRLEQAYAGWRAKNNFLSVPEAVTRQLHARWDYLDFRPRKVALLLPLTGRYGRHGKAIRGGFLRAHAAAFTDLEVRFHNTDQERSVTELYRRAVARGAEAVIGPLLKHEVEELLEAGAAEAPTITLNYHNDGGFRARGELFQFGLLPEDEAVQVAEKMHARGLDHAIALTPDDAWGRRLYRRFEERYTELGGQVQEIRRYDVHFEDYATIVQSLLRLDDSKKRHRALERIVGEELRFTPRIRGDVNAAVLFAPPEKAALIYPLLKYYYAEELPVYATSHVYQPGREKILRELDGLIYCDVPLMIDDAPENARPDEYPRLFALGADAYGLMGAIRRMAVSNVRMPGATGVLSVGANRRLFRRLSWARFARGKPVPLGESW